MSSLDLDRFFYLGVLGGALFFYVLIVQRRHLEYLIRQLVLWALLFIGILSGYQLWEDVAPRLAPVQITHGTGTVIIPRDKNGQYTLDAMVNGTPIEFLIDTGASNIVLSHSDADKAGLNIDDVFFSGTALTANGSVKTAAITLDKLNIGGVQDFNLKAYVTDGDLFGSLLGMTYLQRFSKVEISDNKLTLTR